MTKAIDFCALLVLVSLGIIWTGSAEAQAGCFKQECIEIKGQDSGVKTCHLTAPGLLGDVYSTTFAVKAFGGEVKPGNPGSIISAYKNYASCTPDCKDPGTGSALKTTSATYTALNMTSAKYLEYATKCDGSK